jgi:transposase
MDQNINIPPGPPNVRVLGMTKTEKGEWLIRVESTLTETRCRKCDRLISHSHGFANPIRLRHLPLFEVPVSIELRPKRYRCPWCEGHPTTTEQLSWYEPRSPNTKPYEQWLLRLLINSTITDVSQKLNLTEETVSGVLERWIETKVDWSTLQSIEVLGIDEISLKRGHRDFVTIVSTPTAEGVKVLAVLADRQKETVTAYLASMPVHVRSKIQRVCIDMYQGYANAVREKLQDAKLVVD